MSFVCFGFHLVTHPSFILSTFPFKSLHRCRSQSQLSLGKRQGAPWIRSIYVTYRDRQTFTIIFRHMDKLEAQINLTLWHWAVGRDRTTQRKPREMQARGEHASSTQKGTCLAVSTQDFHFKDKNRIPTNKPKYHRNNQTSSKTVEVKKSVIVRSYKQDEH